MFRFLKNKSKSDNNLVKIYPDDLTDAEELLKNWSRSAATIPCEHKDYVDKIMKLFGKRPANHVIQN
ncbi:MAG: hypothetical protein P1P88_05450 [Bacteroidales bacterium]|nr:hypothetical protein [Bacteroidales bacterium]